MTGFYEGTGGVQEPIPHTLDKHTDVTITGVQDQDVLAFDEDTGQWINTSVIVPDVTLKTLPDTDIPNPLDQQVLTFSAGSQVWVASTISPTGDPINLGDLLDVRLTDSANGDALVYNGGLWVNQSTESTISNPVIVGNGADNTNAGVILNSGSVDTVDKGYIQFQRNGVDNYAIEGLLYQGGNALAITSEVNNSAINLKALGPSGQQYDLTLGTNGNLAWSGNVIANADGINGVRLTGNQTVAGEKTFIDTLYASDSLGVTGQIASSTLTPKGRMLWAGDFGIIEASPYTADDFLGGTGPGDGYVTLDTTQTISGTKTFSATTTAFQAVSAATNFASGNLTQGQMLNVGQFGVIQNSGIASNAIALNTVSITAGNGLTGGGSIAANRTINVGAGSGISVAADSVAVDSTVLRTTGNQTKSGDLTATNLTANTNIASGSLGGSGTAPVYANSFGILTRSATTFSTEQSQKIRGVLLEVANILGANPQKIDQIEAYLTTQGI